MRNSDNLTISPATHAFCIQSIQNNSEQAASL